MRKIPRNQRIRHLPGRIPDLLGGHHSKPFTARLVKISDEMTTVLMGADGMDMTPDEFAEYLEAKARECADRLRGNWGVRA